MNLRTRELVEIEYATMEAMGLGYAVLRLHDIIRGLQVEDPNSPMAKVLIIARSKIEEEEKKAWLNVLSISQKLNCGDASSVGAQPTLNAITKDESSSSLKSSPSSMQNATGSS